MGRDDLRCEKCSKYVSNPVPQYNLSVQISDSTDCFFANAFKAGEQLMDMSPQDYILKTSGWDEDRI